MDGQAGIGAAEGGGLNLLKLSVGSASVEDLARWQKSRSAERAQRGERACPVHVTRMWPRREAELLDGGSLYWVVAGAIAVRQRILGLEETRDGEGIRRCRIVLDPTLVRVAARPCRPFQGWRYLPAGDAPSDLDGRFAAGTQGLPQGLAEAMATFGLRERSP